MIKKTILTFSCYIMYVNILVCQTSLIVNEIFYNPNNNPQILHEYIELYNNSSTTINLKEYYYHVNNNSIELPEVRIAPKQYIILTNNDGAIALAKYGNTIALNRWFALSNTSANIKITKNNSVIDEISYNNNWQSNSNKRNGGWSLERINPNLVCNTATNWSSTLAQNGHTAGKPNTIVNSNLSPQIQIGSTEIIDNKIKIILNTPLNQIQNSNADNFELQPSVGPIQDIVLDHNDNSITIHYPAKIDFNIPYQLSIHNIFLCNLKAASQSINLFQQNLLGPKSVLINEILFNPKQGGYDFVELYNNSSTVINLQNWKIGNRIISNELLLFPVNSFIAITINKNSLIEIYPNAISDNIFQTTSLPAFPNEKGNVILFNEFDQIIDSLYYESKMHHPSLVNVKGISLERQSYNEETNSSKNFKSASTLEGGATPGYKNSSSVENFYKKNIFFLNTKTFILSANNTSNKLEINYELTTADNILNSTIFDEKGRLVKRLNQQQKIGDNGKIHWDGILENGNKITEGHYIILIETHQPNGQKNQWKLPFVVARQRANY